MTVTQIDGLLSAIATDLRAINGRDGYQYAVKPDSVTLDPTNLLTVHESRLPLLAIEVPDLGGRQFLPTGQIEDRVVVAITARVDAPGTGMDRKTRAALIIEADVERALALDPTLGGRAIDARLRPGTILTGDPTSDIVIVLLRLDVDCTRPYGAPEE